MPVLITGASRGLGAALAGALAESGWHLILDARGGPALERVAAELAEWSEVVAIPGDVADPEHRCQLAEAAARAGGIDALVNNAGILGPSGARRRLAAAACGGDEAVQAHERWSGGSSRAKRPVVALKLTRSVGLFD